MLHGFCDDKDEINFVHTELARKLCDRGIAVIRFDFSGSGSSDGLFEDMTISSEIADCLAVLDTVAASDLIDKERIALHGTSLGACIASMVAGMRPDRIKALSMWCPAPDVVYNLKEKNTLCGIDTSHVREDGYIDFEGLRVGRGFYEDALQLDPYAVAAQYQGHVNLVHGDLDITASVECSMQYKTIYGNRANLLIVKGAEHRFKSIAFRKARIDSAANFLTAELLG